MTYKVGCEWKISLQVKEDGTCVITRLSLDHTGGCRPSSALVATAMKARGQVLPMSLFSELRLLVVGHMGSAQILRVLTQAGVALQDTSPQALLNLRARVAYAMVRLSLSQTYHALIF